MSDLNTLVTQACGEFAATDDSARLEEAKARYLGKAGAITELLKGLSRLPVAP